MRRRAFITGVAGQDGSYLAELLVAQGYEVIGMVRPKRADPPPNLDAVRDRITLVEADLHDAATLRSALHDACPHEVYHLAAPTFVPASWTDPTGTVIAIAGSTATILSAALAAESSPRLWLAASSEVFGDPGESPQHEGSPMRPRTPYGVAKLAALGLVRTLRAHHGLFACAGILYNHESPRRPEQFLPRKVTRAAAAIGLGLQNELVLGDLRAIRDWSHAADVARASWLALQHDAAGDYVVSSGVGRTVRDLVDVAFGHVGLDPDRHVRVDRALVRDEGPFPLVGDPSRACEVLGWTTERSFEAMVHEMVDADLAALGA